MTNLDWQLWGTFSVADHLRPGAFVADVLVYNRLLVPVPSDEAVQAWQDSGWEPARQRTILDILRNGDESRVEEIEWGPDRHVEYKAQISRMKSHLAAGVAWDVPMVQSFQPMGPGFREQLATRRVLVDYRNEQRDRAILHGIPPSPVDIVAAYGSEEEFSNETGVAALPGPVLPEDLLGTFAWPFVVPADIGGTDLDRLKRAVEYANQPQVKQYRQAFHAWRGKMVREGKSPAAAAEDLKVEITTYANWVRAQDRAHIVRRACVVAGIGIGLGAAFLPVIGAPVAGAIFAAIGVGTPFAGPAVTKFFGGRLESYSANTSPGALFWESSLTGQE